MIQYLPGAYNLDKNVFVRNVTLQRSMWFYAVWNKQQGFVWFREDEFKFKVGAFLEEEGFVVGWRMSSI